ncbi:hypothetical protein Hanom_Chr15g01377131 [Helianthus anomalus]
MKEIGLATYYRYIRRRLIIITTTKGDNFTSISSLKNSRFRTIVLHQYNLYFSPISCIKVDHKTETGQHLPYHTRPFYKETVNQAWCTDVMFCWNPVTICFFF